MLKINELRKAWSEVIDQMEALAQRAQAESRVLSEEEEKQYETLEARQAELDGQIKDLEEKERLQAERFSKLGGLKDKRNSQVNRPVDVQVTRAEGHDEKGNVRIFGSFREHLSAIVSHARGIGGYGRKLDECQAAMRAATGLNEAQAAEGGWLVQQDVSTELLKRTYEVGVLAGLCRRVGIGANSNSLKMYGVDESSRANGSRWGGVQVYMEGEADSITASKPKFRIMEVSLGKMVAAYYATEELLADTAALEGVCSQAFSEEFAFKLDDQILRGNGAGQLVGVLNSDVLVSQAKEGSQTAATVVLNNITKMRSRLWARSRANARWFINQDIEPQLNILSLTVGNNSYPVLMPATGISGAPYDTMFGRPVIPIEHCETLGTKGDILLLDLSQYLIIDKGSINAAQSIHVRFLNDERCFRFTYRVGGQPLWHKALTPYKGTATQSPFISLDTRS